MRRRGIVSLNDVVYNIKAAFGRIRWNHARGQEGYISHSRWWSSSGDADSTADQFVQCVARAPCQILVLVEVDLSPSSLSLPTPDLYLSLQLPFTSPPRQLLLLPSACISQELEGSVMSAGVLIPTSRSVHLPSKAASTSSGTARVYQRTRVYQYTHSLR